MGTRTTFTDKSIEGTTRFITFTLLDQDGNTITSLDSLALTLFDKNTGDIINSLDGTDVSASFSAGTITYELVIASMGIHNTDLDEEIHVALFEWGFSGSRAGKHEFEFTVVNYLKV